MRLVGRRDEVERDETRGTAANEPRNARAMGHTSVGLKQKIMQHLELQDRRRSAVKTIWAPCTRGSEIHDLPSLTRKGLISLPRDMFSHVFEQFSFSTIATVCANDHSRVTSHIVDVSRD